MRAPIRSRVHSRESPPPRCRLRLLARPLDAGPGRRRGLNHHRRSVLGAVPLEGVPRCRLLLATSGDYRIYYDEDRTRHHIVTPGTGWSPTEDTSVTVVAPDAYSIVTLVMDDDPASSFVEARDDLSALFLTRGGDRRTAGAWTDLRIDG